MSKNKLSEIVKGPDFKRAKCLQYNMKILSSSKIFSFLYGDTRNALLEFVLFCRLCKNFDGIALCVIFTDVVSV